MTTTIQDFAQAVKEIKEAPFGYSLAFIRQEYSDAIEACQVHANGPRMASLVAEVRFWHEEMRKWEHANELAKIKDWSLVGA